MLSPGFSPRPTALDFISRCSLRSLNQSPHLGGRVSALASFGKTTAPFLCPPHPSLGTHANSTPATCLSLTFGPLHVDGQKSWPKSISLTPQICVSFDVLEVLQMALAFVCSLKVETCPSLLFGHQARGESSS